MSSFVDPGSFRDTIWIACPLKGIDIAKVAEIPLGDGFSLMRTEDRLSKVSDELGLLMSPVEAEKVRNANWFLVLRIAQSPTEAVDIERSVELLQDALMTFQIVKPIETYGLIFHGTESNHNEIRWNGLTDRRWPMAAGTWAQLRHLDEALMKEVHDMWSRTRETMKGAEISKRNAVHLLQMALEHPHPYIACLLSVTGIEAILDSRDRWDFEAKLCALLGPSTLAFPDWNSPLFSKLRYTIRDIAVHLYTLRSKIAHGVDLTKATQDRNSPVDLREYKEYISWDGLEKGESVRYATLLGESSVYILCQVLQEVI
jgi:hypothetical protein